MSSRVSRTLRVLLIQLPLLDSGLRSAHANVPLAAGCLAAACRAELSGEADIALLPRALACGGGDAAVMDYVRRGEFDVIGFTAYLWNVERSLDLALRIKSERPTLIVMGGPEIVPGRRLLAHKAVDAFVCGDGEPVFPKLLRSVLRNEPLPKTTIADSGAELPPFPNPYLAGIIPAEEGHTLHLETMRGCAGKCAYCFYAKARPAPQFFPDEMIGSFFAFAAARRAGEIYLMDPSFDRRPRFDDFLQRLADWNRTRIPLHTEIRLENVTPRRAELLSRAGFVSVEAGLQSVNPSALAAVRRTWDRDRFLRGAEGLKRHGIAVRVGVILGLPADTLDGFAATLDFLVEHGLGDEAEIYPLSVLPGSLLAHEADALGLDAMRLPPYWLIGHRTFPFEDFFRAEELIEEKLGKRLFARPRPRFQRRTFGFVSSFPLEDENDVACLKRNPHAVGNELTLLVSDRLFRDESVMAGLAHWYASYNPHTFLRLVVRTNRIIGDDEARRASDRFFIPGAFPERCHAFADDAQGRFSVRLFALMDDAASAHAMEARGSFIDPILAYRPGLLGAVAALPAADRPPLLIPEDISAEELHDAQCIYGDCPEHLWYYGTESDDRI